MLLESLLQVVEKLQERIQTHGDKLRQSEALTRSALVDPLLRALGWDTEDPALVMPEFRLGSGPADYALLSGGKPAIVIEAKKLGTSLESAAQQGITYCINDGIPYFATTDGRKWDVYETHKMVPIADKRIVSLDLAGSPADVCLDALALWRRSVQSGAVRKAQTPVIEPDAFWDERSSQPPIEPPVVPPNGKWITLSQFQPAKGDPLPLEIRFPDGSTSSIKYWNNIPIETVRWLVQSGNLNENAIPLQEGKRYILSHQPMHSTGTQFKNSKQIGNFYLEANYNSDNQVKNTVVVIEKAGIGVDPSQFSVRLS